VHYRAWEPPIDHLLAPQVHEHRHGKRSAQRQDGVEVIVPLGLRHVGEVHLVDAGYEGERQEDSGYGGQALYGLV
jgi:hypothetical protein